MPIKVNTQDICPVRKVESYCKINITAVFKSVTLYAISVTGSITQSQSIQTMGLDFKLT